MGSKRKFISKMEKCKDWVLWCKPKDARLLRLNGVKNPLGFWNVEGHKNQNMYILNGEYSFSYWSTLSGSYQTGSFHSEDYVLKKALKCFSNDNYTLWDSVRSTANELHFLEDRQLALAISCVDGFGHHAREERCSTSAQENWSKVYFPPLFLWGGEKVNHIDFGIGRLIPTPHTKHHFTTWATVSVELEDNTIIQAKAYDIDRL